MTRTTGSTNMAAKPETEFILGHRGDRRVTPVTIRAISSTSSSTAVLSKLSGDALYQKYKCGQQETRNDAVSYIEEIYLTFRCHFEF